MKYLILTCAFFASFPTFSVDGVFEISDLCALTGGCFTGDSAGYPVTISAEGSYVLTSGLMQTSVATSVIQISADNVSLDLNGFALKGSTVCTGIPVISCTGMGGGDGIRVIDSNNTRIFNGSIIRMADDGIYANGSSQNPWLDSLIIAENGNDGIQWDALASGQITNSSVFRNRNNGLSLGFGSMRAADMVVRGNGNWGQFGGYCSNSLYTSNNQAAEANCIVIESSICGAGAC